jgi:hypothetical protein
MVSMMIKMLETTKWDVTVSNGTYIFNKKPTGRTANAIGFIAKNATVPVMFKKPITIDFRYRTFEQVK